MAVAASPLPLPPAAPQGGMLDLMLRAAAGAAPGGSPEIVNAAAQSSQTPDDAATAAQASTGYMTMANAVQQLKTQPTSYQRQFFDNASGPVQDQLRAAGFSPPGGGGGGFGGFLHRAVHDVLHNPVTHVLGEGLASQPVADTLNAMGSGLRFAQHLERTAMDMADSSQRAHGDLSGASPGQGNNPAQGLAEWGTFFGKILSPSEWSRRWDETSSGKSYILPQVKRQAAQAFDPDTYQLALKLATGADPQSLLQAAPPDQQQGLAQKLQSDPDLHKAVAMLNDGHLSVGQFLVGEHFLVNHPGLGHALSGLTDATMDWFGDPLVIGGKLTKGASTARWLIKSGDDVRDLYGGRMAISQPSTLIRYPGSQGFRNAVDDISSRIASQGTDATAGLLSRYPKLEPVLPTMVQKNLDSPDKVVDFFADDLAGTSAIISGNAAHVAGKAGGVVPHLTWAGQARLAAKGALTKTINFAADGPNTLDVDPADVIDHPLNPPGPIKTLTVGAATGLARKTGMSARRLTTLVSDKPTFDATDPRALSQLRNILLYALPAERADQLVNAFAATPDIGLKRSIYFGAMKELGHGFGIDEDSAFWQKYLTRFTSEGPDNANSPTRFYAPGDIGSFDIDSTPTNVGILAKDAPTEWGVPDFRRMYMEGKKSGMLRSVVGASNTDFADKFMKPWRNLTLARPGFGFRVAGDEAFAGLLRDGPAAWLKARTARTFANRTAQTAAEDVGDDELASTYDRLLGHLPAWVRAGIRTPVDAVAANLGNATSRAMAGVDTVLPESKYVDAARRLAQNGVNDPDGAFARMVSAAEHPFDSDIKATSGRLVYLKDGNRVPAEIAKTGAYKNYEPADSLYLQMWHKQLSDLAKDAWSRTSLEHIDDTDPLDRVSAVADHIEQNPEFWSRFVRSLGTRDGRLVATGEVTSRQAAEDHALAINQLVDSAVLSPGGDHIRVAGAKVAAATPVAAAAPRAIAPAEAAAAANALRQGVDNATFAALSDALRAKFADPGYVIRQDPDGLREMIVATMGGGMMNVMGRLQGSVQGAGRIGAPGKTFGAGQTANLADHLLEHGSPPSMDKLGKLDETDRPDLVKGPEYLDVVKNQGGLFQNLANKMFEKIIGPQIDWISRQPIFLHNYATSWDAYANVRRAWQKAGISQENIDKFSHEYAMQRATNLSTPYIHNPDLKSQFSVLTRNLAPFWFAQEQFYKRWARTMAVAPWGFRQAQLINQGMVHSGFVHTDPQTNQEYFVYPGSSIVTDALTKTLGAVGIDSYLPVNGSLTGQIKALSPGFERPGIPNVGPFLVAPMNVLKTIDPNMTKVIDAIEGKQAASQGILKPFIPGNLQRVTDLVNPEWLDHSQYASAQMQAMQYLEATGHGIGQPAVNNLGQTDTTGPPPAGAGKPGDYITDAQGQTYITQPDGQWRRNDPAEQQAYLQRVKNWARIFLMSRAVFGFSAPAAPEMQFNPDNLHNDLQTYLKELPFNEAIGAFMKQHPNATPYTVFQTQSGDGTPPPATAAAMNFFDTNKGFMEAHRDAGSYFIPLPASKGPFDLAAYQEQMADGFRLKKAPTDFYNDIIYAQSAQTYFQALDNKNKLVAHPPADMSPAQVNQQWSQWSKQFMDVNPIFADQLASSTGALKRARIMEDVGQALNDPSLPPTPQTAAVATLYQGWRNWQTMVTPASSPNAPHLSTSTKNYLDGQFALWAEQYVKAHPEAQALYDKAIHPGLISTLDALAAQGVTT